MERTRVVIVGGGFAGVAATRELERIGGGDFDVTLVSLQNFMLFTPMLPEVAAGSLDARDVMQPLRARVRGRGRAAASSNFELGEVTGIDLAGRAVTVRHPVTHESRLVRYDQLVLAVGATASTMGVPGVEKFTIALKTVSDAEIVRTRVVGALEAAAEATALLERDRLLRFAIVGGGFTGVELAGELQSFLTSILRCYPQIDPKQVEIVVVESGERLLDHLPAKFGRYAASKLRERGIVLRLKQDVGEIDDRGVHLKGAELLPSATVVWAAGVKPSPLVEQLGLKTTEHGAIETGADFAVVGAAGVWALGDCAAVPKPGGGTYAPLAQNAIREGALLARNIVARTLGRATRSFRYRERGQMAALGNREAVIELPGGHMFAGLGAWLIWRTYYLGRLPGRAQKARVALDWTLNLAFGPQSARLPMVERGDASFPSENEAPHAVSR